VTNVGEGDQLGLCAKREASWRSSSDSPWPRLRARRRRAQRGAHAFNGGHQGSPPPLSHRGSPVIFSARNADAPQIVSQPRGRTQSRHSGARLHRDRTGKDGEPVGPSSQLRSPRGGRIRVFRRQLLAPVWRGLGLGFGRRLRFGCQTSRATSAPRPAVLQRATHRDSNP